MGNPQHLEALQRGLTLQSNGDFANAENIYKQILQAEPEHPEQMHVLRMSAEVTTPEVEVSRGEALFVLQGACHDGDRELVQGR